ncbi:MAG: alpha/beta hydrolase family protein [Armatimonadota bacterium]
MAEHFVQFRVEGQAVYGMMHLPEDKGKFPAVALCHGFTGNRIEAHRLFVKMARMLAASGIAALRFDFRGSGESEGDFEQVTVSGEITDALAALDFLRKQPEIDADRIGLLGLSLGGCVATCTAARDGKVKALVLWAAVADLKGLSERMPPEARESLDKQGWIDFGGWKVSKAFYEDAAKIDPLREALRYDGAVLIVHGANDPVVPVDHAHRYHAAFQCTKRLHIVPEADHTFARLSWEEEVMKVTLEWFKAHL